MIQRRRRSDWADVARPPGARSAAYRAGVALATATLEAHDSGTADHSDDVVEVSDAIAEHMGLGADERMRVAAVAQLHDIGKVAVPTEVLTKPGPLTEQEWEVIRLHTVEGERMLAAVPEMGEISRLVRHTHERYDGGGYPDGLSGEDIPLAARIVFCADAFHAMRCDRPYRQGRPATDALAEIERHAGTQFDPGVAAALHDVTREFRAQRRNGGAAVLSGRNQRLAALLLTLVVGGSALAATGSWRNLPFAEGSTAEGTAPCGPAHCASLGLGRLGVLPVAQQIPSGARVARSSTGAGGPGAPAGAKSPGSTSPGRPGGTAPGPRLDGPGRSHARRQAGSAPATPSPRHGSSPPPSAKPVKLKKPKQPKRRPGRSGEAPRRPQTPVRGGGGAPGRSDEAPGKPDGPGRFGHKD